MSYKLTIAFVCCVLVACSEKTDRNESGAAPAQIGTNDAQPVDNSNIGGGSGNQKPTSSVSQCNSQGQAFSAVVIPGESPSGCVGQLAPFGCCIEVVNQLFRDQQLIGDVNTKMQDKVSQGMKLYNCEMMADNKYRFHFANVPGPGRMQYASVTGEGDVQNPGSIQVNCPQIPDVSFLEMSTDVQGNTDTDTNSANSAENLQVAFADVVPLLTKNCGACHDPSSTFVGQEELFKAKKDEIKNRLELPEGDPKRMPLINEQNPDEMDETERLAIILYINDHISE